MPDAHTIDVTVNGAAHRMTVEARCTLLDLLRRDLALTGSKKSCDMGECGACTVHLDGQAVYACITLAVDCADRRVTTIEGIADDGRPDALQQAFVDADAFQCGFCTPGQIMSLEALFAQMPAPTDDDIVRAVAGNLCRCGAYRNIVRAGRIAAGRA